jgi:FkbM family methyltransferase
MLVDYVIKNKLITPVKVIDIGTRGGFSKYWELFQNSVKMFGFEPDETECKDGINNFALSNSDKERKFYVTKSPASSSFYPPDKKIVSRWRDESLLEVLEEKEIKPKTLDSFNIYPDFIDLDAEGAELDILQSGTNTLKSCIGLEIEVNFVKWRENLPLFADVDTFLRGQGFNLYNIFQLKYPRKPLKNGKYYLGRVSPKGQLIAGHAVYFRDLIPEIKKWNPDKVLKQSCLMELYDLPDCAIENLVCLLKNGILDTRNYIPYINIKDCYGEVSEVTQ